MLEEGLLDHLAFVGGYLDDAALLGYAYAFEQATGFRKPPPTEPLTD